MTYFDILKLFRQIHGKRGPDSKWIRERGLLAVKIAHRYAMAAGLLDKKSRRELGKLYRHCERLPIGQARQVISSYVGSGFLNALKSLDDTPLGCGSVAQVHRAQLADGRHVAIKFVRRAEMREEFQADLARLRSLLKPMLKVSKSAKQIAFPEAILKDIETYTLRELDLTQELAGIQTLQRFKNQHRANFYLAKLQFPKIEETLSGNFILVSDYVEGKTFDQLLQEGTLSQDNLVDLLSIQGFFMFMAGAYHGDLHPGNVILSGESLFFVDNAYVAECDEKTRLGIFHMIHALARDDHETCAIQMNKMPQSELHGDAYRDYKYRFRTEFAEIAKRDKGHLGLGTTLTEALRIGAACGMEFPESIHPLLRNLTYLGGMISRFDPGANPVEQMSQVLEQFTRHTE